jgi:hypothetical protein
MDEIRICKQRGHSLPTSEGWSQCEWCGLWLREVRTIEERENDPPPDQSESRRSVTPTQEAVLSLVELATCRRRGHSNRIGKRWSKCAYCGFWLREKTALEERVEEPPEEELSLETQSKRALDRMQERTKLAAEESDNRLRTQVVGLQNLAARSNQQRELKSMTICKACGGEISFAYLEKHVCPTPNPEYEKERDKYREALRERNARNERLGIIDVPTPPVWIYLEVLLNDGAVLKYALRRGGFEFTNNRLIVEPEATGGWSERIIAGSIRSYRFREFQNEAEARALAQSGG